MKFVDEVEIQVRGGHGGRGCVSFLREKYRPRGGPAGGDGGHGGSVVLVADGNLSTLLDFKHQRRLDAESGEDGRGKMQYGKGGSDLVMRVPAGTVVRDAESGEVLADLARPGDSVVAAQGGRGGWGNIHYATSTNQAPRIAMPGLPGEERLLRLELQLLADVGLVGYPNAGKSSLIRLVSAARPRVADYPFTTLVPHLGVVRVDDTDFVLADVPGLIEGAHRGEGLGLRFLRHLSRTMLLLHIIDASGLGGRDPLRDFEVINAEMERFDATLAEKPQIVVANKIDLAEARDNLPRIRDALAARGIEVHAISAVTRAGVDDLMRIVAARVAELKAHRRPAAVASA
jgi:GTP-binding protein